MIVVAAFSASASRPRIRSAKVASRERKKSQTKVALSNDARSATVVKFT